MPKLKQTSETNTAGKKSISCKNTAKSLSPLKPTYKLFFQPSKGQSSKGSLEDKMKKLYTHEKDSAYLKNTILSLGQIKPEQENHVFLIHKLIKDFCKYPENIEATISAYTNKIDNFNNVLQRKIDRLHNTTLLIENIKKWLEVSKNTANVEPAFPKHLFNHHERCEPEFIKDLLSLETIFSTTLSEKNIDTTHPDSIFIDDHSDLIFDTSENTISLAEKYDNAFFLCETNLLEINKKIKKYQQEIKNNDDKKIRVPDPLCLSFIVVNAKQKKSFEKQSIILVGMSSPDENKNLKEKLEKHFEKFHNTIFICDNANRDVHKLIYNLNNNEKPRLPYRECAEKSIFTTLFKMNYTLESECAIELVMNFAFYPYALRDNNADNNLDREKCLMIDEDKKYYIKLISPCADCYSNMDAAETLLKLPSKVKTSNKENLISPIKNTQLNEYVNKNLARNLFGV